MVDLTSLFSVNGISLTADYTSVVCFLAGVPVPGASTDSPSVWSPRATHDLFDSCAEPVLLR